LEAPDLQSPAKNVRVRHFKPAFKTRRFNIDSIDLFTLYQKGNDFPRVRQMSDMHSVIFFQRRRKLRRAFTGATPESSNTLPFKVLPLLAMTCPAN